MLLWFVIQGGSLGGLGWWRIFDFDQGSSFRLLFLRVDCKCNRPSFLAIVFESTAFNGDLSLWDVAKVTNVQYSKSICIVENDLKWRKLMLLCDWRVLSGVWGWWWWCDVKMVKRWRWRMREIECTPMTHCNNVYGVCDKGWYSNAFWALRDFMIFCYKMSWFRDGYEMSFVRFCCCLLHNFLMRFPDDILRFGQCHFRTRFCFEILYVFCSTVLL